jgi:hypothetical protein
MLQLRVCKCGDSFRVPVKSKRKLCNDCLYNRVLRSQLELHNKKGRDYRVWLKNIAKSIERAKRGIK